jgi:hypothetical protein
MWQLYMDEIKKNMNDDDFVVFRQFIDASDNQQPFEFKRIMIVYGNSCYDIIEQLYKIIDVAFYDNNVWYMPMTKHEMTTKTMVYRENEQPDTLKMCNNRLPVVIKSIANNKKLFTRECMEDCVSTANTIIVTNNVKKYVDMDIKQYMFFCEYSNNKN